MNLADSNPLTDAEDRGLFDLIELAETFDGSMVAFGNAGERVAGFDLVPLHSRLLGTLLLDSFDADSIFIRMAQFARREIDERLRIHGVA